MRIFIAIAYKGTNYHGWQIQPNAHSVQQEVTQALHTILRNQQISIVGSGRTDAGVHAKMQVAHADVPNTTDIYDLMYRLNAVLPKDIVIIQVEKVDDKAHARFDATKRSYEYHLRNKRSPFCPNEYYYYPISLNYKAMNKAAESLHGQHDFTSFSKVKTEVNNFECTIFEAKWEPNSNGAVFYISANRFLRGMVRAIVGSLLLIGEGKQQPEFMTELINVKDRTKAGRAVPANGLYLSKVIYPYF